MTFNLGAAHTSKVISLHGFLKVKEERPTHIMHPPFGLSRDFRAHLSVGSSLYLLLGSPEWGLPLRTVFLPLSQMRLDPDFLLLEVWLFMCGITQGVWCGSSPSGQEMSSKSAETTVELPPQVFKRGCLMNNVLLPYCALKYPVEVTTGTN